MVFNLYCTYVVTYVLEGGFYFRGASIFSIYPKGGFYFRKYGISLFSELKAIYGFVVKMWEKDFRPGIEWLCGRREWWGVVGRPLTPGDSQYFIQLVSPTLKLFALHLQRSPTNTLTKVTCSLLSF